MHQDLLDQLHMRTLIKQLVKHDNRTRPFEAVASHFQLIHRVNVENVEANRGTVWRFGGPQIQVVILAASFKEQRIVAIRQLAQFVDERQVVLRVELGVCR